MSDLAPNRPLCPTCGTTMSGERPAPAYRCTGCGSAWLPRLALTHANVPLPDQPVPRASHHGRRPCPGCDRLMALRGNDSLQVDVCVWCGGLFLDAGELEQLAALKRRGTGRRAGAEVPVVPGAVPADSSWGLWVEGAIELLFFWL